jgi:hypothetical protein
VKAPIRPTCHELTGMRHDAADVTNREAAKDWGWVCPSAHDGQRVIVSPAYPQDRSRPVAFFPAPKTVRAGTVCPPDKLIGANTMRSLLILGLLMSLCASANAATLHHHRSRHHVVIPPGVASSYDAVPGWTYAAPYNDAPSYYDPSKSGGSTALPID